MLGETPIRRVYGYYTVVWLRVYGFYMLVSARREKYRDSVCEMLILFEMQIPQYHCYNATTRLSIHQQDTVFGRPPSSMAVIAAQDPQCQVAAFVLSSVLKYGSFSHYEKLD